MRLPCGATTRWVRNMSLFFKENMKSALSMVHFSCKSAQALTFENFFQDICQEACDAVQ
jgi:hypothetical protein